ncbi:MAG: hypothetical protein ACOX79_04680 [Methanosarcina sp.]
MALEEKVKSIKIWIKKWKDIRLGNKKNIRLRNRINIRLRNGINIELIRGLRRIFSD